VLDTSSEITAFALLSKTYAKAHKKQLAPACTAFTRNIHLSPSGKRTIQLPLKCSDT
jgi:hypothetical protein